MGSGRSSRGSGSGSGVHGGRRSFSSSSASAFPTTMRSLPSFGRHPLPQRNISNPTKVATPAATSTPAAQPTQPTLPTPHAQMAPSSGGFFQSIKEGFGFGVGSSLASRAVSAVFGAPSVNVVHKTDTEPSSTSSTSSTPSSKGVGEMSCETLEMLINTYKADGNVPPQQLQDMYSKCEN